MSDDDMSDLSSLSSLSPPPPDIDDEVEVKHDKQGIMKYFTKTSSEDAAPSRKSPPPRKREPSPPHETVFADNPDIAFIVMFRKRFDSVMPRSLAHFGPLELEQDIQQEPPAERVEHFLCVVLGLLLNRKQDIKIGHYNKALGEDAIGGANFKTQWPSHWTENPLRGGTFHTITPDQRVDLLKTLVVWALGHSDAIKVMINTSYNGKRTSDDLNQPLSVQPWGVDSDKRRYFLVEGDDNCSFRVYRESNPAALYNRQWISVAGSIDEAKALADKLATADGGPNARKLSNNITKNVPNFEEKEEKRKRREYRRQQKERFRRPEPGFSVYEGRTRGKRVKYTYSDDEDFYTDSTNRRSARNTRNQSPAETGPVVTASGRQSRPPTRLNVDTLSNGDTSAAASVQGDMADTEMSEAPEMGRGGRPRRAAATQGGTNGWTGSRKRRRGYVSDDEEDESEPDLGDDDEEDHVPQDETDDEEEFENDAMDEDDVGAESPGSNDSHVVKLPIKVKFDKHGKVKRLLNDDTPSASTPSNMISSPEAPDESSEDTPSDAPNYEPERTEDVVNVVPLKRQPDAAVKTDGGLVKPQPTSAPSSEPLPSAAAAEPAAKDRSVPSEVPAKPSADDSTLPSAVQVPPESTPNTSSMNGSNGLTQHSVSGITAEPKPAESTVKTAMAGQAPPTPMVLPASPSLAFRGSPEKPQTLPRVVAPYQQD